MPMILSQNLTINDPAKDSYFFDMSAAVSTTVVLDAGASLFNGQKVTVVIKQNASGTGILTCGASIQFDSGIVPSLPLTPNAFLIIEGMVLAGVLHATSSDLSAFIPKAGGTMTGVLTLAGDPTNPLESATKQYVDAHVGGATQTYHPITGHRYGFVGQSVGASVAQGVQPQGLTTRLSVTEYSNAPIVRLDTPLPVDLYAGPTSAPNAVGFEVYVDAAGDMGGTASVQPIAYAVFREQQRTADLFVNPFAVEVMNNPVGAGIPIGLHHLTLDRNMLSLRHAITTPPAWICTFADPQHTTPNSLVGLVSGTNYPLTLEYTNTYNSSISMLNDASLGGGLGYNTPGTYANVPLTSTGPGVGATANITVALGQVTSVVLVNPGTGYTPGDVLSANPINIGGRTGGYDFSINVGTVAPVVVTLNVSGTNVTTYASLITELNNVLAVGTSGFVRCAWSFGNTIVFTMGGNVSQQTMSYLRVSDQYTPGSLFYAIGAAQGGFWGSITVPSTGPQVVELGNSNYDGTIADLHWYFPVVGSTQLNVDIPV